MKLAIFDFDSTLMDGETLEFLAKEIGIEDKIKNITDKAMKGELDFFESLNKKSILTKFDELTNKSINSSINPFNLLLNTKMTLANDKICFGLK